MKTIRTVGFHSWNGETTFYYNFFEDRFVDTVNIEFSDKGDYYKIHGDEIPDYVQEQFEREGCIGKLEIMEVEIYTEAE